MDIYSEEILDHYKHPHHAGVLDKPDFDSEDSNPLCGDKIRFSMKQDAQGHITDVAFQAQGCAISKASASLLTDHALGKSVEELGHMRPEDMLALLGIELTPARVKCALLGQAVMRKSILEKKFNLNTYEPTH